MAMRRRAEERQRALWVATQTLPTGPRRVFYERLNRLLVDAGCDLFVEDLVKEYYAENGRPGVAPGVYFWMLFVGYFEGIDSQRGIAWRCAYSLSLRSFLGLDLTEKSPDHSSPTRIRDRYPIGIADEVFAFVLGMARERKLISGAQVGVDATLLEANPAMKLIVRRDTVEDWKAYLRRLMFEDGLIEDDDEPTDVDVRRLDRSRKGKNVSNEDWKSPVDDDARIVKMKDGRNRLGYKAEHTVELESEFVLSATVQDGIEPDSQTLCDAVIDAQDNLERAGSDTVIAEVAADKGYHANAQLTGCDELGLPTYIPEPSSPRQRKWTDKCDEVVRAVANNRRRMKRPKGKQLQRLRSERVERSFAHVCETGGARRTWLRGLAKINKRYRLTVAARNLGLLMKSLFGTGKPRQFAALRALQLLDSAAAAVLNAIRAPLTLMTTRPRPNTPHPDCRRYSTCVIP
jgi:transposase